MCLLSTKNQKKKKIHDKIKTRKNKFIFSFISFIRYLHLGLSHLLMVKLLPFLPITLCSHWFYMCKHTSHALAAWCSCLSLWFVR